jgi:hypothetical protein
MTIRVTRTRPISKPGILPYPGFLICRVLRCPSLGLPTTPCLLQIGFVPSLKESIPFDPTGDPVPLVFLQLPLIFFNQHSQHGFYPLSRLPLHVLLPHVDLWVVRLDQPVAKIIGNDHILTLGHLGLIRAHQNFLVFELDHTNGKWVRVELHLAFITENQSAIVYRRLYLSLKIIAFIRGMSIRVISLTICFLH